VRGGTDRQTEDDTAEDVGVEDLLSLAFLHSLAPVLSKYPSPSLSRRHPTVEVEDASEARPSSDDALDRVVYRNWIG
jgi:hypothetical protein